MPLRRRRAQDWSEQYAAAMSDFGTGKIDAQTWWKLRVEANWGLISRGSEAIPFATKMLESGDADTREDGAGVLAEIGKDEASIDLLIASLQSESENQPRDAIVQALGHLKSKRAIPSLALLVRDPGTDGDTRQTAIVALGMIVGRRFERRPNPETEASAWLRQHGTQ